MFCESTRRRWSQLHFTAYQRGTARSAAERTTKGGPPAHRGERFTKTGHLSSTRSVGRGVPTRKGFRREFMDSSSVLLESDLPLELRSHCVPQEHDRYTETDHAVWRQVMKRSEDQIAKYAD